MAFKMLEKKMTLKHIIMNLQNQLACQSADLLTNVH